LQIDPVLSGSLCQRVRQEAGSATKTDNGNNNEILLPILRAHDKPATVAQLPGVWFKSPAERVEVKQKSRAQTHNVGALVRIKSQFASAGMHRSIGVITDERFACRVGAGSLRRVNYVTWARIGSDPEHDVPVHKSMLEVISEDG